MSKRLTLTYTILIIAIAVAVIVGLALGFASSEEVDNYSSVKLVVHYNDGTTQTVGPKRLTKLSTLKILGLDVLRESGTGKIIDYVDVFISVKIDYTVEPSATPISLATDGNLDIGFLDPYDGTFLQGTTISLSKVNINVPTPNILTEILSVQVSDTVHILPTMKSSGLIENTNYWVAFRIREGLTFTLEYDDGSKPTYTLDTPYYAYLQVYYTGQTLSVLELKITSEPIYAQPF